MADEKAEVRAAAKAAAARQPQPGSKPADQAEQSAPMDRVEVASMDSFPCSDPPGYGPHHA